MSAEVNEVGFVAAGLVLATFCMRSMSALRWVAIASNVAFIAYGYLGGLAPVLLLHTLLLPVNICRLAELRSAYIRSGPNGGATLDDSLFRRSARRGSEMSRRAVPPDGRPSWMQ